MQDAFFKQMKKETLFDRKKFLNIRPILYINRTYWFPCSTVLQVIFERLTLKKFKLIYPNCFPTVRGPYPTLAGPPQITPVVPPDNILASSSVHLLCTYDIKDPRPFQVGYKVTWYKIMRFLGGKPGKLVLRTNTTEETAVMINFESAEFHLGDTVSTERNHLQFPLPLAYALKVMLHGMIRNDDF